MSGFFLLGGVVACASSVASFFFSSLLLAGVAVGLLRPARVLLLGRLFGLGLAGGVSGFFLVGGVVACASSVASFFFSSLLLAGVALGLLFVAFFSFEAVEAVVLGFVFFFFWSLHLLFWLHLLFLCSGLESNARHGFFLLWFGVIAFVHAPFLFSCHVPLPTNDSQQHFRKSCCQEDFRPHEVHFFCLKRTRG